MNEMIKAALELHKLMRDYDHELWDSFRLSRDYLIDNSGLEHELSWTIFWDEVDKLFPLTY